MTDERELGNPAVEHRIRKIKEDKKKIEERGQSDFEVKVMNGKRVKIILDANGNKRRIYLGKANQKKRITSKVRDIIED